MGVFSPQRYAPKHILAKNGIGCRIAKAPSVRLFGEPKSIRAEINWWLALRWGGRECRADEGGGEEEDERGGGHEDERMAKNHELVVR